MYLVDLRDIYFKYLGDEDYALKGVTLTARPGEFILLAGPSGCGKSTLLRVLNGLVPHFYEGEFKGEAYVAGLDVRSTPTYALAKHVGMVFQDPENQLFLSSVEREIAFSLENLGLSRNEIKKRVNEVLEIFGLEHIRHRAPYELSGGQQQKVALATVMALEPQILALDEPTANLDPLSALEVLTLVHGLVKKKGILAIVVEHRLEIALRFATRMLVMNKGHIVADGKPEAILPQVRHLIGYPPVVIAHLLLSRKGLAGDGIPLTPEDLAAKIIEVVKWRR
ncbi:MAG: energy-coupling factor ABC transporter ATP-binding protein [Thermofilaceae archaeon]|nr:energy-coupling factor ABC transporter ATP-binding protein [Thermofilaceae archaeon]MCX8180656.1 energy-coupling factor ABC transporter ATP-binding protein [Thermofilaceae archaeon]MDW8003760.1 ABC transporter ATP-binding protein [Thermofilaceae archaeon]